MVEEQAAVERAVEEQYWLEGARAVAVLTITAIVATIAACLHGVPFSKGEYLWANRLSDETARNTLVGSVFAVAALAFTASFLFLVLNRRNPDAAARLRFFALRVAPLGPLAAFSCLFSWKLYNGHELSFLTLVLLDALALGATIGAAVRGGPSRLERRLLERVAGSPKTTASPRAVDRACAVLVGLAIAAFIAFFSYSTVVWHRSVRSGYDLAIEDNILWNLLHRGGFFHAAPTLGPTGSHFSRHATVISYLLLPFYALHQSAETLHVLQTTFVGLAAAPLFLFARRRLGSVPGAVLALAYLLHPAVEEGDLFEMHYVKLGAVFFFLALWLLDTGRVVPGLIAAAVTLLVREDVASWVVLLGLFLLLSNEIRVSRRVAVAITAVSTIYVFFIKFVVMPSFIHGDDDLLFMYTELLPAGRRSFAWVLASVFGNPVFTLTSLLEAPKLLYLLLALVPLAFVPMRRGIGFFALIPGILYCFLGTKYPPLIDIHYQYTPHVLAFEFPAAVFALGAIANAGRSPSERRERAALSAALVAIAAATLACSYQYGSVFQQNTSRAGPFMFKFGWDDEGRGRYRAMERLKEIVPPTARVASSALVVPQFSARHDDYSLSLGVYDADWIVSTVRASELVGDESARLRDELASGRFGVVSFEGPFFAAQRGAPTGRNASMLGLLTAR